MTNERGHFGGTDTRDMDLRHALERRRCEEGLDVEA